MQSENLNVTLQYACHGVTSEVTWPLLWFGFRDENQIVQNISGKVSPTYVSPSCCMNTMDSSSASGHYAADCKTWVWYVAILYPIPNPSYRHLLQRTL